MNQVQAVRILKELLGSKFAYRYDPKAAAGEERGALLEARRAATSRKSELVAARKARREQVLAADAEYQRLRAESIAAQEVLDRMPSLLRRRVTVIRQGSLCFSVVAEGDNWAEVVEKVRRSKAQASE